MEARESRLTPSQAAEPLSRRSSVSEGASIQRQSRASRVQKSWILDDTQLDRSSVEDAHQAGLKEEEAIQIVKYTTRFATTMCVVIACVKVSIYFYTQAEVVRTSALDSIGDLTANMITLYTGYKMTNVDHKRYPVGHGKFQSIGCLVFSTLMFALMFGNALGNVESLLESKDDIGFEAITRFFDQTRAIPEFHLWHRELKCDGSDCEWVAEKDGAQILPNPLIPYFAKQGTPDEKELVKDLAKTVTRGEIVEFSANYENEAQKWSKLKFQNTFLGCCATYKCCLWLYCIYFAIPKSGSSVLVALATDKRNDFICTSFVILATFFAAVCPQTTGMFLTEEKVDPFVSLILSVFIMYTWSELMKEHMTILSHQASPYEFCSGVEVEVRAIVKEDSPCTVDSDDIKAYVSGMGNTVEVTLTVKSDKKVSCSEVCNLAEVLRKRLQGLEDTERVMIFIAHPKPGP